MIILSLIINILINSFRVDTSIIENIIIKQNILQKGLFVRQNEIEHYEILDSTKNKPGKNVVLGENEILQLPPGEVEIIKPKKAEEYPVDPEQTSKNQKKESVSEYDIFTAVEEQAEFPGGPGAWGRYLQKTLKYPEEAQRANKSGRVFISFVVNINGSIQDVQVLKGVGFGCDEEAVRVIRAMPRWKPGKQSGQMVRSRFTQPITFVLTEDEDKKSTPSYSTYTPPVYQPEVNSNKWKESVVKTHFANGLKYEQEGIYEEISYKDHKYKLAFLEEDGAFKFIFLKNSLPWNGNLNEYSTFKEGDSIAELVRTANENIFTATWKKADRSINDGIIIIFRDYYMDVVFPDGVKNTYLKLYPSYNEKPKSPIETSSYGSGFAISSNGIIATNHHVIEGASTIKVRGINGDFTKAYRAKVLVEDKNNDLALLQIQDSNFYNLGVIPYTIGTKSTDVGSSIFVLGYPMKSSMGDEVKVTDGIISANSGYKNDITTYQISAPAQPGNSGGPLLDKKGNILGVISSKHTRADNATYAIKASYLLTLINQLPRIPSLQTKNLIYTKSLPEQIKTIKKFTYIIEVN